MPGTVSSGPAEITVDVVYATPEHAICKSYRLCVPATVGDALRLAALDTDFAALDFGSAVAGVFGKVAQPTLLLAEGDRVEIYRDLAADPKTARRARVERARRRGR